MRILYYIRSIVDSRMTIYNFFKKVDCHGCLCEKVCRKSLLKASEFIR